MERRCWQAEATATCKFLVLEGKVRASSLWVPNTWRSVHWVGKGLSSCWSVLFGDCVNKIVFACNDETNFLGRAVDSALIMYVSSFGCAVTRGGLMESCSRLHVVVVDPPLGGLVTTERLVTEGRAVTGASHRGAHEIVSHMTETARLLRWYRVDHSLFWRTRRCARQCTSCWWTHPSYCSATFLWTMVHGMSCGLFKRQQKIVLRERRTNMKAFSAGLDPACTEHGWSLNPVAGHFCGEFPFSSVQEISWLTNQLS